jgi:hypothetical protein
MQSDILEFYKKNKKDYIDGLIEDDEITLKEAKEILEKEVFLKKQTVKN